MIPGERPIIDLGQLAISREVIERAEIPLTEEVRIQVGETVTFDGGASRDPDGTVVLWRWDFGDGATASTHTPTTTHAYRREGTYVAILVVVDNDGNESPPFSRPIVVFSAVPPVQRPIASFTVR